jgi:hypothetical protein
MKALRFSRNGLATLPARHAEITHCVFCEAVETPAERLVVDVFPHIEKPLGRIFLGECDLHVSIPELCLSRIAAREAWLRRSPGGWRTRREHRRYNVRMFPEARLLNSKEETAASWGESDRGSA